MSTALILTSIIATDITRRAIIDSTSKIYDLIKSIISINHPIINNNIDDLDLYVKLQVINSLMNDIESNELFKKISSLNIILEKLHEIIDNIHNELKIIDDLIKQHHNKWFHYFRTLDYSNHILNLQKFKNIMDTRLNLLLDLLKINF